MYSLSSTAYEERGGVNNPTHCLIDRHTGEVLYSLRGKKLHQAVLNKEFDRTLPHASLVKMVNTQCSLLENKNRKQAYWTLTSRDREFLKKLGISAS